MRQRLQYSIFPHSVFDLRETRKTTATLVARSENIGKIHTSVKLSGFETNDIFVEKIKSVTLLSRSYGYLSPVSLIREVKIAGFLW